MHATIPLPFSDALHEANTRQFQHMNPFWQQHKNTRSDRYRLNLAIFNNDKHRHGIPNKTNTQAEALTSRPK